MIDARRAELVRRRLRPRRTGTAGAGRPSKQSHPCAAEVPTAVGLAPLQERFWFHQRQAPRSTAFNIRLAFALTASDKRFDAASLVRAFAAVFARQEVLRTCYEERRGEAVQVVVATAPRPGRVDLRRLGPAAGAEARRLVAGLGAEPFDLAAGPPLRAACLDLGHTGGARHTVAVLVLHHVAWDGGSAEIFLRQVGRALHAGPDALREPRISYRNYAADVRGRLDGGLRERQVAYWRDALAGCPETTTLPFDHARSTTGAAAQVDLQLDGDLLADLAAQGRRAGTTPFMTLLAAWFALLERLGAGTDLPVGVPVHARTSPRLESTIGCFVNTLVLRGRPDSACTFADLLADVRRTTISALDHADLPFEEIVRCLVGRRRPGIHPLCQIFFSHQETPRVSLPNVELTPLEREVAPSHAAPGVTGFDLSLALVDGPGDGGVAHLVYDTALFEAITVERIGAHFELLLRRFASGHSGILGELPRFSHVQRQQLVDEAPDRSLEARQAALGARIGRLRPAQKRLFEDRLDTALQHRNPPPSDGRTEATTQLGTGQRGSQTATLVTLRAGGEPDRSPLVVFHPVGGSVYCHREWTAALADERPILGVQAPGLDTDEPPLGEMRQLAAAHAETLVHHGGPATVLVGWSFGGLLALDTAQALDERGHAPAMVVLIDAWPPEREDIAAGELERLVAFARELAEIAGRPLDLDPHRFAAADPSDLLTALYRATRESGLVDADLDRSTFDRLARVHDANLRAMATWRPRPWHGPTSLILAGNHSAARRKQGEDTWRRLCHRLLDVTIVPGDHAGMLRGRGALAVSRQVEAMLRHLEAT